MRRTIALAAAAAALSTAAVGATTAAGSPSDTATTARAAAGHVDARRARVPNEVGRNHQAAQDDLQAHGFFNLRERDCTARGRLLLFDRNWRVAPQTPPAGARASATPATPLSGVKNRACPARACPVRRRGGGARRTAQRSSSNARLRPPS